MCKGIIIRGSFLTVGVLLFYFLFTINDISAYSSSEREFLNNVITRRITNDYSNFPQYAAFDATVSNFINKWDIVGASVAVINDGKLVYAKGFGHADLEKDVLVQPEHLFRVASISKLVTAVAIVKMEELGLLSLDDKVFGRNGILNDSVYLKFRDKSVERITVRHLLEHSAGWTTRSGDPMFQHVQISNLMKKPLPIDAETIIQYVLTHQRLFFAPGTRSAYSNVGYAVLGKVIEKVTSMPYEQYVQQNILFPMGIYNMKLGRSYYEQRDLSETAYYDKEGAELRLAYDGTGKLVPRQYGGSDIATLGAAGGWIASTIDLMKLMTYIDGFSNVIDFIDPVSIEKLTCPRSPHLHPLGWRDTDEDGTWYRTGTLAGTSTLMVRQNNGISYVALFNTSNWRGARFTKDINGMMDRALATVDMWPDMDLFNLHVPNHIKPKAPAWWVSNIYKF
jgi:CubicO group peptidase (beta-lactamase class C family)